YVIRTLASQNMFTISATDPTANQPDPGQVPLNVGLITVTRGGFSLNAVSVTLGLDGPGPGIAVEGVDHMALPRSVFFPAGASSQTISVTPLANTNLATPVIATLKLLAGAGYKLAPVNKASVVIYPSATAAGTGL